MVVNIILYLIKLFLDTTIVSSSCTILDQILDYFFERMARSSDEPLSLTLEPEGNNCLRAIDKSPNVLFDVSFFLKIY